MSPEICLALAIFWEARGESSEGQQAVAQVVLNRVEHHHFPNSICGVVFAKNKSGQVCAFSWACDGKSDDPKSVKTIRAKGAWEKSKKLAKEAVASGEVHSTDALYFHSSNVKKPKFWKKMKFLSKIGRHVFYR